MKSLLLITHEYPLNRGDAAFIKSEMPYLAETFDRIHVLCVNKPCEEDSLLDVPKNVSVSFANVTCGKIKKRILQLLLLSMPVFYKELQSLFRSGRLSIDSVFTAMWFLRDAILFQATIKRILRQDKNIGLIYTYWYVHETLGALLLKKQFNNVTVCTRTHGYDLYTERNRVNYQPYKLWMDRRIDKVFFISKHGYDYYLNKFAGCGLQKYTLARLGIVNKHNIENVRVEESDTFFICSCSYIVPVKRVHLIIKALEKISDHKIHWVHIGDGADRDAIELMANELLNNKDNITYEFKGFMKNEQVMRYYSENYVDCFISASESEGLPVSMMEALSFGIPIIATDVGGVSELVNENTGILLGADGNVDEISRAIVDLYDLPEEKRTAMRRSARAFWESNFNAEINHAKFAGELAAICN